MRETAIAKAIRISKGQMRLRAALKKQGVDVTQQAISTWNVKGYAPARRLSAVAKAVNYRVSVRELRRDLVAAGVADGQA